jgi:hypothetical protein
MKRLTLAFLLLMLGSRAYGYRYWNDIRHSALLPDNNVTIRVENPSGAGIENYLLYAGAGIVEQAMIPIADGPSTVSASVPGPVAASRYYGFRLIHGAELDLLPVRIADGVSPAPSDLTRLAIDPAGDQLFGYTNLDLVDCRVSLSGTKIFAALKNAGGGFPVSQGLTFFGYLLAIANPASVDPDTVFALMQTYNQPGIISPGLYKITGSGLGNLTKIGNVSVQEFPATNTLLLSCNLADLMADPYFQSWYDPADPALGVAGFTQRITLLGGAAESDRTPGGRCSLRSFSIDPFVNQLPALANLIFEGTGSGAFAQIDYGDPNGHCPVAAEIAFDGGAPYPMYPQTLNYTSTVAYVTEAGIDPLANDSWTSAVARFSDNLSDTVETKVTITGVSDGGAQMHAGPICVSVSPNPFNPVASIEYLMPAAGNLRVEIYDVRGGLVRTLLDGAVNAGPGGLTWNGRNNQGSLLSSGLYFCRITALGRMEVKKLLLIR